MNNEQTRKEFEVKLLELDPEANLIKKVRDETKYTSNHTQFNWEIWQAALASAWRPISELLLLKEYQGYKVSEPIIILEHYPNGETSQTITRVWEENGYRTLIDARHRRGLRDVTHFMPLPTPPAKQEQ